MLIGRVEHDPKKQIQAQLPESTINRLDQYRELYQLTFGEKVSTSDLVDLMLRNVMDRDREFKRFLKDQERKEKQEAKQEAKQQGQGGEAPAGEPRDGGGGRNHTTGEEDRKHGQPKQGMGR
ncbi:hypothetical protein HME01_30830 [Vreelandella aquamarina]|uniref:DUF2274 domain-containing protein n=2 Tax=Oceanospirillales TaxID=135619 RepID=A0A1N6EY18_9GAMM|nr:MULTISPECIES: DUF2274 domain-containing protein [Halomonas]MCD1651765.1 DUF2274 domain-containing protein [Halomonas axialensis]MCD2089003.1 DUF2274 domain-containing protein [Halomonas meridiana]MCO7243578.1 DUF2274 domain-containing protein [Halomonas sp. Ps84H-12]CDG56051.1 conserved hypothetical protein [Halomonas sp. A3H3]SIN84725.1 hypothetical protein SAMN05878249_3771 [Halomonas meridiana]